jgi:acetoacetyl-CoA synthetase
MDSVSVPRKLWEHPDPKSTEMYRLMQEIKAKHNLRLNVSLCHHIQSVSY